MYSTSPAGVISHTGVFTLDTFRAKADPGCEHGEQSTVEE